MNNPAKSRGISEQAYQVEKEQFIKVIKEQLKGKWNLISSFIRLLNKREFLEENIFEFIKRNYDDEAILNVKAVWNNRKVTQQIAAKLNTWNKENRTNEQYLIDIISAWISEDYLREVYLQNKEIRETYDILRNGSDAKRTILRADECTRDTDLKFVNKKTGEEIFVEVTEDNSGYVKQKNKFDLRWGKKSDKYTDLMNLYNEGKVVYIYMFDIKNKGVLEIPVQEAKFLRVYNNPRYEGRLCTELEISSYKKYFKSIDDIIA